MKTIKTKETNTPVSKKFSFKTYLAGAGLIAVISVLFYAVYKAVSTHFWQSLIVGVVYVLVIVVSFAIARAAGNSDEKENEIINDKNK